MMKKKSYNSRKFLNKDSGLAAIETTFEFNPDWKYSGGWEANVRINDCYRAITLELSCYNIKDIDKVLKKVETLLTEIEKLGNLMLEYREAAIEHIKAAEDERKKRKKERKVSSSLRDVLDDLEGKDGS